jgi:hypothetical protein
MINIEVRFCTCPCVDEPDGVFHGCIKSILEKDNRWPVERFVAGSVPAGNGAVQRGSLVSRTQQGPQHGLVNLGSIENRLIDAMVFSDTAPFPVSRFRPLPANRRIYPLPVHSDRAAFEAARCSTVNSEHGLNLSSAAMLT